MLAFCLMASPYMKTSTVTARVSQETALQARDVRDTTPITVHVPLGKKSWSVLLILGQVLPIDHFSVVRKKFRRRKDGSIYPLERAVAKRRTILPVVLDGKADVLKAHANMFGGGTLSVNGAVHEAIDDQGPYIGSPLKDQIGEGIREHGNDPEKILDGIFEEQEFYPAMLAQQDSKLPRWMGTDAILPKVESGTVDGY
jgi:hypothetical protein